MLHQHQSLHSDRDSAEAEICPTCGRASVRLLQCGWLVAVKACNRPDCPHPLLGPVRPVTRSYTELSTDSAASTAASKQSPPPADPTAVTCLIASTMNSSTSTVIIGPDDVFVRCKLQLTELPGLASAAAAIRLFCRVTDGDSPLRKHLSVYKRCLRSVRASFRLSTSDSLKSDGGSCHFRGLTLDAAMSAAVDRELTILDADLTNELSSLLADCSSLGRRNLLYNCLRKLFRYCARARVCFKQLCTVCFEQNTFRSRCSVLRLTNPANDFDLNQPMKRVLLRPCGSCGAENQRVLISWESSPPALLVESPEGVPSAAAAAAGSKPSCGLLHSTSLSTAPGVEYLPTAMIEQRRRSKPVAEDGADCFDYIAWLFNSDSERWMAMSSESRFASYAEDATPPTTTTNSKILCILYERQPGPVAAAALPDSESDVESVDQNEVDIRNNNNNKSELETSDRSSEPAPTNFNDKTETASISSTAGRSVLSLRHRLESVMQSRRQNPTSSKLLPPGLGSVDDSYVMSRFLDVVATTAAAAASPSDVSFSSRRHSRRHRLRGYLEDNRQRRGVGVGAATSPAAASVAYDEASTKTGSDQASEFDVLNLFL
ncbi:hypothetical protein BOX15_Mlig018531g1 [Macrostomum lignano]|uniref:Uncharacterized protein n=2 Tax=Macrostomum lignano TaxID=282301 RepID=A0A267GID0_9PLAT|nr:hypothetical protein BOX15_Mlig018531g1 [Macrostomum lignano]